MSMAMKVMAGSMFLQSLGSYLMRVLMLSDAALQTWNATIRQFVLPVPVTKIGFLAHLHQIFGISTSLRDTQLVNVAALVSTAMQLGESLDWSWDDVVNSRDDIATHPMRMRSKYSRS